MLKVVRVLPLPMSVCNVLNLMLMVEKVRHRDIVEQMLKEELFSMLRFVLSRSFGDVISIRFSLSVIGRRYVVMKVSRVETVSKVYAVKGVVEVDTVDMSMLVDVSAVGVSDRNAPPQPSFAVCVSEVGEEYEVGYCRGPSHQAPDRF